VHELAGDLPDAMRAQRVRERVHDECRQAAHAVAHRRIAAADDDEVAVQ
jgi:hypothetical protein